MSQHLTHCGQHPAGERIQPAYENRNGRLICIACSERTKPNLKKARAARRPFRTW